MKRLKVILVLLLFFEMSSFAQKMVGLGGELSVLSLKPCATIWISKYTGFEVFTGISSETSNIKFNDYEAGFKFLETLIYKRTDRTYCGFVGKWKQVNVDAVPEYNVKINLPVFGLLIGKEWYSKRISRKAFAVELGYQYGAKQYSIPDPKTTKTYEEFAMVLNLRYVFVKRN